MTIEQTLLNVTTTAVSPTNEWDS